MIKRTAVTLVWLSLAMLPAEGGAVEGVPSPPPEICTGGAGWADDDAEATAQEFEQAFREFDQRFTVFSERFAEAFDTEEDRPDMAATAALRAAMEDVYRALARLIPLRDAGDEAWPMKLLLNDIPGGVPLPELDPPDRDEVLRAAFLRELTTVALPGEPRSKVRFLARLDMTRMLLDATGEGSGERNENALRILADDALVEAYDADFRRPALRVLDDGWHTSLASRLRSQVARMCGEVEG